MCLCIQPYRRETTRFLDVESPHEEFHKIDHDHHSRGIESMTDNLGLTYIAVRNCDLERFSAK